MIRRLLVLALLAATPAAADELVSGISQDQIEISSNYAGTEIVVFGAIENVAPGSSFAGRDIVVVVRGPDEDFTVRKRVRVAGIWVNSMRMVLRGMPSYYYIATTRPLADIASPSTLRNYDLGIANLQPAEMSTNNPKKAEPYRLAIIRERLRDHLYASLPGAVEFLSPTLFRVRIPVPATVPTGHYNVEVSLFRDGTMMGAQSTPFFVDQVGLERRLFKAAHAQPFAYGVAAVLVGALLGWLSSFMFRRTA